MCVVLSPFADNQAAEVASWPLSADEARSWAGGDTGFPLEPDQLRQWHDDPDVHPFVTHQNGHLVAYGELWVDRIEQEIELARIIVRPTHRNARVGRSFVKSLVDRSATFGLVNLILRVLPTNRPAIRCYEAAGFVPVSLKEQETYNQDQPQNYLWLKYGS